MNSPPNSHLITSIVLNKLEHMLVIQLQNPMSTVERSVNNCQVFRHDFWLSNSEIALCHNISWTMTSELQQEVLNS